MDERSVDPDAQAMRRHRKKKRAAGLCGYNGCKTASVTYFCDSHRAKAAAYSIRHRESCRSG